MSTVSIVKCSNYEINNVRRSIKQAINSIGGIQSFVSTGDRVLLKPNLLMKRRPEKVTTTHPAVVQALAELVIEAGGKPVICDSPGEHQIYSYDILDSIYDTCGMKDAALKSGAELNYNTDVVDVHYEVGKMIKSIKTIKPVMEIDKIINIPKFKTHMMTGISGAVKNLFGIIPGTFKSEFHYRFKKINDFSDLLIDVCMFAKPTLNVMDAIFAMEGNGPTAGHSKNLGLILVSEDPYSMDMVAAKIIGFKPNAIPTVKGAIKRNLCSKSICEITISGESIEDIKVKNFRKPTINVGFYYSVLPKFIINWVERINKIRVLINYNICVSCGVCARSCPSKAIKIQDRKPNINDIECIKCFCCHELCKYEAITIERPWFIKLLIK